MPIAATWNFDGNTIEQYEQVFALGGDAINQQPNRLAHVCFSTPTGFTVVDVWTDEAAFAAFGAVIGPAIEGAGLHTPPTVHPVQGFMAADGVRNP